MSYLTSSIDNNIMHDWGIILYNQYFNIAIISDSKLKKTSQLKCT